MKNLIITALLLAMGSSAFAKVNAGVEKAASELRTKDVRTVITEVENTDENPCLPEGKSFQVELQVKQAQRTETFGEVKYVWETVKTINVDKNDGRVMEICLE